MALNSRIDAAKFVTIPEPLATRILPLDQPKMLSREIKSKIFETLIPFSDHCKQRAVDMFKWVNLLSGGALEYAFELKSDNMDEIPFRLLNPRVLRPDNCDEFRQKDNLTKSYIAASYCWQLPQGSWPRKEESESDAHVNASETTSYLLPMSPLLYNALLNERESQSEGVWIDQVCINQSDESEKQVAVNAMDVIYKCARAVVILLDDIDITKTEQQALKAYILDFENTTRKGFLYPFYDDEPPYMTTNILMRNIYLKLIRSRWFSRAWCMHEARLGKQHIFLIRCEEQHGSPPTVLRFTNFFMLHLISLGIRAKLERGQEWLVSILTKAIDDSTGVERRLGSFMQVFTETFSQNAGGNPRIDSLEARQFDANLDKLSIAMNTIGVGLGVNRKARDIGNDLLPPTEDECCRRFTIIALAAWDPSALCASGHELRTDSVQRSWMRWPLLTDANSFNMHRMGSWSIGFDPSPASKWIALHMGFFNRTGGLRWASEARLKICAAFLENCGNMGIMMKEIGGKKLNLQNEVWRNLIIRTLACAMDCGLEWLTATGDEGFERYITSLMKAGLQKLLDSEAEISRDDSPTSTLILTRDEYPEAQSLIDLAMYLIYRGPAVETALGQSMGFWQPACMANETGSKVLTFVRRPPGRKVFCASPLTLFPDYPGFYSNLFRAWTLVKGEPEREQQQNGKWVWKYHLMGKSRIFGKVMSSDEEHAFATIVHNVRVYGPIYLPL